MYEKRGADEMRALAWRCVALLALALGLVGLALPIVPQLPFLLVAAAAAAKGWPALDARLRSHPVCGPIINGWRERRALPARAKVFATIGLASALGAALLLPLWAWLVALCLVLASLVWIWSRPEG